MSRNRKVLSEQKGNLTVEQKENIRASEEHCKGLAGNKLKVSPPKWLKGEIAKKEYRKLAKLLTKNEFLGELDENNLAVYCNAFEKYQNLNVEYEALDMDYFDERDKLLKQITIQTEIMRKYAGTLGLTVDSRLKLGSIKSRTIDDDIAEEFGDI